MDTGTIVLLFKLEMLQISVRIIEMGYVPTGSEKQLSLCPTDIATVYNELEELLPV